MPKIFHQIFWCPFSAAFAYHFICTPQREKQHQFSTLYLGMAQFPPPAFGVIYYAPKMDEKE